MHTHITHWLTTHSNPHGYIARDHYSCWNLIWTKRILNFTSVSFLIKRVINKTYLFFYRLAYKSCKLSRGWWQIDDNDDNVNLTERYNTIVSETKYYISVFGWLNKRGSIRKEEEGKEKRRNVKKTIRRKREEEKYIEKRRKEEREGEILRKH